MLAIVVWKYRTKKKILLFRKKRNMETGSFEREIFFTKKGNMQTGSFEGENLVKLLDKVGKQSGVTFKSNINKVGYTYYEDTKELVVFIITNDDTPVKVISGKLWREKYPYIVIRNIDWPVGPRPLNGELAMQWNEKEKKNWKRINKNKAIYEKLVDLEDWQKGIGLNAKRVNAIPRLFLNIIMQYIKTGEIGFSLARGGKRNKPSKKTKKVLRKGRKTTRKH